MSEANNPHSLIGGCANKEENKLSAMIDWCQITVKGLSLIAISEKLLGIPYSLMRSDKRKGIKGYNSCMCFDDIRVLEPRGGNKDNGYQLLMSGTGCRNFERVLEMNDETWYDFLERVLKYGLNIPRLDIAIDDRKTYFRIPKLIQLARKGFLVTRMRVGESVNGIVFKDGQERGATLRIGSRSSTLYMVFYEKNYEQAKKFGIPLDEVTEKWNRYELRFKQEKAVEIARILVERRVVSSVASEVLNESIRFVRKPENSKLKRVSLYPLWEPWEWFIRDVEKIKLRVEPKVRDYYSMLGWIRTYVAPALKVIKTIDNLFGMNNLEEAILEAKLNDGHLALIESCREQVEMEKVLFQDSLEGLEEKVKLQKERMEMHKDGWFFDIPSPFSGE